jgi:hypothetical protein
VVQNFGKRCFVGYSDTFSEGKIAGLYLSRDDYYIVSSRLCMLLSQSGVGMDSFCIVIDSQTSAYLIPLNSGMTLLDFKNLPRF